LNNSTPRDQTYDRLTAGTNVRLQAHMRWAILRSQTNLVTRIEHE